MGQCVIEMRTLIALFLFLIIFTSSIVPISVKASNNITVEIKVDIVKRHPDLVITDCNETYVYWEYNFRKLDPPVPVREPANETRYQSELRGDYLSETFFIINALEAKYDVKDIRWFTISEFLDGAAVEIEKYEKRLIEEKGNLGIFRFSVLGDFEKIIIMIFMYKITPEKVNIVANYLRPFTNFLKSYIEDFKYYIKELNNDLEKHNINFRYNVEFKDKYDVIVAFVEDYASQYTEDYTHFPLFLKQSKAVERFYSKQLPNGSFIDGDEYKKYLELLKEYYGLELSTYINRFGYGEVILPIPTNATYNEEFIKKAVSIIREYVGCEVPLVANFVDYRDVTSLITLAPAPNPGGDSQSFPSLSINELILLFAIIPTAILLPLILIARKGKSNK
jgi:hypothetical protein